MKKKPKSKPRPVLNLRRKIFCKEYLLDLNGTQAAVRAGFSAHTANEQASRLLANVSVRAEIDRLRRQREERLEASADFVVRELMRIAKFDIAHLLSSDGTLKSISSLSPDVSRCISSIEIFEEYEGRGQDREFIGYTKKVKVCDKVRSLEALGEHFGIFKRPSETDPKKEAEQRKGDLLQVIKIISKDGQTTTVSNRIRGGQEESPEVDQLGARSYEVL